jgi:hypothetical protein
MRRSAARNPGNPDPDARDVINYRDLMVLKASGCGRTKLRDVPVSDGAGEVVGLGAGVSRFVIGGYRLLSPALRA